MADNAAFIILPAAVLTTLEPPQAKLSVNSLPVHLSPPVTIAIPASSNPGDYCDKKIFYADY